LRAHHPSLLGAFPTFALLVLGFSPSACADKPAWIDAFSGWAGPNGGMLYARVHKGKSIAKPMPNEASFERLEETVKALEANALEHATVSVAGVEGVSSATADDNGFIALPLPSGLAPGVLHVVLSVATKGWVSLSTELVVQVWDDLPDLGVISDIDDTLTDTGVTHKAKMILGTFFHSEYEVKIFPASPQVLWAVVGDNGGLPVRALFYLSGSPWGLHERLEGAFDRAGLPRGAMILRRYSTESLEAFHFKHAHLQALFKAFPHRCWVLFGDTGERIPRSTPRCARNTPTKSSTSTSTT
jgi:phosphatidate phosphatase APP1